MHPSPHTRPVPLLPRPSCGPGDPERSAATPSGSASVKRSRTKRMIHGIEATVIPTVQRYLRMGSRASEDYQFALELELERSAAALLRLLLRLDQRWPHRERWI